MRQKICSKLKDKITARELYEMVISNKPDREFEVMIIITGFEQRTARDPK